MARQPFRPLASLAPQYTCSSRFPRGQRLLPFFERLRGATAPRDPPGNGRSLRGSSPLSETVILGTLSIPQTGVHAFGCRIPAYPESAHPPLFFYKIQWSPLGDLGPGDGLCGEPPTGRDCWRQNSPQPERTGAQTEEQASPPPPPRPSLMLTNPSSLLLFITLYSRSCYTSRKQSHPTEFISALQMLGTRRAQIPSVGEDKKGYSYM